MKLKFKNHTLYILLFKDVGRNKLIPKVHIIKNAHYVLSLYFGKFVLMIDWAKKREYKRRIPKKSTNDTESN